MQMVQSFYCLNGMDHYIFLHLTSFTGAAISLVSSVSLLWRLCYRLQIYHFLCDKVFEREWSRSESNLKLPCTAWHTVVPVWTSLPRQIHKYTDLENYVHVLVRCFNALVKLKTVGCGGGEPFISSFCFDSRSELSSLLIWFVQMRVHCWMCVQSIKLFMKVTFHRSKYFGTTTLCLNLPCSWEVL